VFHNRTVGTENITLDLTPPLILSRNASVTPDFDPGCPDLGEAPGRRNHYGPPADRSIAAPPARAFGVIGQTPNGRSVYLSGMPATLDAGGTFEFRNSLPGRHAIGTAMLTSFSSASYPLGSNGEFNILRPFPGNDDLQIQIAERTAISRKVTRGDEDVKLELIVGAK
jgi:hypothetical protein